MLDLLAPRRSAHASIRGYLYQSLLGVERWLELGGDEGSDDAPDAILCEGDEDLDRLIRGHDEAGDAILVSEQVKDYSGSLGIGDRVLRETLVRFLVHWVHLRRRGDDRRFLFTTTAPRRTPRGGLDVLAIWDEPDRRAEAIEGVRHWVRSPATAQQKGKDGADSGAGQQVEEALAWLDEQGAWDELFGAVRWRFDAPRLDAIRRNIARLLARRDVAHALCETLTDRLLSRVLEASVQDAPEDRVLTSADLDGLVKLTEQELVAWLKTETAIRLRETRDEAERLERLLHSGWAATTGTSGDPPPPSELLTAAYEIVPFEEAGRERELEALSDWCDDSEPASVFLLHGGGGAGKTRLLIEWCRRLRHQGWHAGFLDRYVALTKLEPLFEGVISRLVVIDYGETRPELVARVLHRLEDLNATGGPKVRVVLLARTAGSWWRMVQDRDEAVARLVRSSPDPFEVTPLVPAEDERPAVVARTMEVYAATRGVDRPEPPANVDYSDPRYDRILYLHVEALLPVLRAAEGAVGEGAVEEDDPASASLAEILNHERRAWVRAFEGTDSGWSESTQRGADRFAAALILFQGAASEEQARALLEIAASALDTATTNRLHDLFRRLYPSSSGPLGPGARWIEPLEPNLVGEELLRRVLITDIGLLDRLLDIANDRQEQGVLVVVGRLLEDRPPPGLAQRVDQKIGPEKHLPVALRETAETATRLLLEQHYEDHPEPDERALGERSRLLNNLSNRLAALGRREEALATIEKCLEIRYDLAGVRPEAFGPDLAMSLNNLSNHLADLGDREVALSVIEESVAVCRNLSGARVEAVAPYMAMSLNNLSLRLAALGRSEEALSAIEECVEVYRDLAGAHSEEAFRPALATSLNNLSLHLADLGHREEALSVVEESVEIYRDLTGTRPEAFRPDLALSLNTLSNRLAALGRREEALAAIKEAVKVRRELAGARPQAFGADLATSLNNLSVRLAALGHTKDALTMIEESVELYRQLADDRPEAFDPDLAGSLTTLSNRLAELDRVEEALSSIEEAVKIRRDLAGARPDAFGPDLAMSLNNLSLRLGDLGRREEARPVIEEAVRTLAPHFLRLPRAFESWMRTMVGVYVERCEETGTEPDGELVSPIRDALDRLGEDGDSGV